MEIHSHGKMTIWLNSVELISKVGELFHISGVASLTITHVDEFIYRDPITSPYAGHACVELEYDGNAVEVQQGIEEWSRKYNGPTRSGD